MKHKEKKIASRAKGKNREQGTQAREQIEHPAGRGGPSQQAGGPENKGGEADEDRNP